MHFISSLLNSQKVAATTAASWHAGKPRKQTGELSRACCLQLAEFPWGVSGTGHSVCQTESHPAGSPCSTFHPERNYVLPHFRRKTAVWCSILETCERSVIEKSAVSRQLGSSQGQRLLQWLDCPVLWAKTSGFNDTHINFNMLSLSSVIKHQHMLPVIHHHTKWFVFMQTPYTWGLDRPVWSINSWSYTNPLIS